MRAHFGAVAGTAAALAASLYHVKFAQTLGFDEGVAATVLGPAASLFGLEKGTRLEDCDLVQAHVYFRHGARSPFLDAEDAPLIWKKHLRANFSGCPTAKLVDLTSRKPLNIELKDSEAKDTLAGGLAKGALTNPGLQMAKDLGASLRERYVSTGFIEPSRFEDQVLLRSSRVARTVETVLGVVTGMTHTSESKPKSVNVLVGETGVGSGQTDWLIFSTVCCPRLRELYQNGIKEWNGGNIPPSEQPMVDKCIAECGLKLPSGSEKRYGVAQWRDGLSCRMGSGLPLFPGVTESHYNAIDGSAARQFMCWFKGGNSGENQVESLRLAHGRTMGELLDWLTVASKQEKVTPKLVLYGGHDVTVMPLLIMLAGSSGGWPNYCSDVSFELWRERAGQRRLFVRVTHGNGCGGQPMCELSRFRQAMKPYLVQDFDSECGLEGPERVRPERGLSKQPGEGTYRQ